MAHEIETMAYAGQTPWHGLGVKVLPDLTPAQMMDEAGVNWRVKRVPAYAEIDGQRIPVGRSALVRESDNSVLDVVGDDWNEFQNEDAFNFFNEFVEAGNCEMHTAGSLKSGRMVWALARIKDTVSFGNGDTAEPYFLFSNPHAYGKSIDVRLTAIRVVCNNTLTLALGGGGTFVCCWSLIPLVYYTSSFCASFGVYNKKPPQLERFFCLFILEGFE
jgi:phage/plasmid-like protein (TIGR03299 family)